MKWFNILWWKYLFSNLKENRIRKIICRIRNHPCGVVWYNISGFEPDMHCKNCDDLLD